MKPEETGPGAIQATQWYRHSYLNVATLPILSLHCSKKKNKKQTNKQTNKPKFFPSFREEPRCSLLTNFSVEKHPFRNLPEESPCV